MKKTLQIANILALAVTVFINYYASAGLLTGTTIADISAQYASLFTPAGYAFSIWGLIYLMLGVFVFYQALGLFKRVENNGFIRQVGWWFVLSCIANCLWIVTWVHDLIGISVVLMVTLLFSLLKIVVNTNMERWDAPFPKIVVLWWPFCFYSGWVSVALIANVSAYLTKLGWSGWGLGDPAWAIIMIIAAGLINLFMIWSRNMREFALVGVWALVAIAVPNWMTYAPVAWAAMIVSAVLFIAIAVHGYQNRATAPYIKWQEYKAEHS